MRAQFVRLTAMLAAFSTLPSMDITRGVQAQTPPVPASLGVSRSFEVASVKPNRSGEPRVMIRNEPGGRFVATNVPLRVLIRNAYGLQEDSQIANAPSWIGSDRFDIVAKAGNEAAPSTPGISISATNLMLQALLAERFGLRAHRETRELPIYALERAPSGGALGPRLQRTTIDCIAVLARLFPPGGPGNAAPSGPVPAVPPPSADQAPPCGSTGGPGRILAQGMTMAQLASNLSGRVNRVVVDRTALSGDFDLDLEWTPDQFQGAGTLGPLPGGRSLPTSDASGPSIYTALQEQLGLRLESTRGPVEVLVIDRVEQPTAD